MQTKIATYGAAPLDLLSTKRTGPLRHIRAWDFIPPDQLAKIPPLSYTALTLARMTWPQLAAPTNRGFKAWSTLRHS